ncbi:MAG: hypothetical protein AAF098_04560 [Pseudomonadota bacterium]
MGALMLFALWLAKSDDGSYLGLFLSADQRGIRLYNLGEYEAAADNFENPRWVGSSLYKAGAYLEAADAYARSQQAVDFFNRGNAQLRAFEYRKAIQSYELAVEESPQWMLARENLALARYTLAYLERTREQSDTGEEGGIGADEVVYDNDSNRGTDTQITQESAVDALSTEKWMRSVDTDTADFLRSRFFLEDSQSGGKD